MKTLSILPASLLSAVIGVAALMGAPQTAKAASGDYCREYTRTVYIGGRSQDAYGTACLQPDGSWMIVGEGLGNDIPDDVSDVDYIIHDNRRDIIPTRVVYYNGYKQYHRRPPAPVFVWYDTGHYRGGHYVTYKNHHHGRGKGHNRYYVRRDRYDDDRRYHDRRDYGYRDRDDDRASIDIRYRSGW